MLIRSRLNKKETKIVTLYADTLFESSARQDLLLGRNVEVVGLDLRNGTIRATKVTVYEGNRPVRMGTTPVTLPNGLRRLVTLRRTLALQRLAPHINKVRL